MRGKNLSNWKENRRKRYSRWLRLLDCYSA